MRNLFIIVLLAVALLSCNSATTPLPGDDYVETLIVSNLSRALYPFYMYGDDSHILVPVYEDTKGLYYFMNYEGYSIVRVYIEVGDGRLVK